jgi:hypothetical protein
MSTVARRTFTVDTVAPQVLFTAPTPAQGAATGSSLTLAWGATEAVGFSCRFDGQPFAPCASPLAMSGFAPGGHSFDLRAVDAAGNVATASRLFEVLGPPVTPPERGVADPDDPGVRSVEQSTGRDLTIRIAGVDRRVNLAELRQEGVTITVIPAQGTQLVRFRIFRAAGSRTRAAGAAAARRPLITLYRRISGNAKRKITLKPPRRLARRLTHGRYVLEVTPGAHKRHLGKPSRSTFVVHGRPAR